MRLFRIGSICGALLVLVGCNGGYRESSSSDGGPVSAYVVQEMVRPPGEQYKFVEGAFSRLVFAIENNSDDLIILRDCSVRGQLPDIHRWHGARYGQATYKPLEDIWTYNEMAQQLSEPVFATGVIRPHGKIKVVRWALLKEDSIVLDVAYQRLTKTEAEKYLYVETDKDEQPSMSRKFRHPEYSSQSPTSQVKTNWQLVIFPEAAKFPIYTQAVSCSVSLKRPEMSIETAQAVIGDEIRASVYWKNEKKWVVKTDEAKYLVDDKKYTLLPDIDFLSFGVIASSYKVVNVILPLKGYEGFNPQKPKIGPGGFYDVGATKIAHGDMPRLFKLAADKGDKVTVLPYDANGLGLNFYILVGDFDEAGRRKLAEQ